MHIAILLSVFLFSVSASAGVSGRFLADALGYLNNTVLLAVSRGVSQALAPRIPAENAHESPFGNIPTYQFTQIIRLRGTGNPENDGALVTRFLERLPSLQRLQQLELYNIHLSAGQLTALIRILNQSHGGLLRRLRLTGMAGFRNEELNALSLSRLQELTVQAVRQERETGVNIPVIFSQLPELVYLDLFNVPPTALPFLGNVRALTYFRVNAVGIADAEVLDYANRTHRDEIEQRMDAWLSEAQFRSWDTRNIALWLNNNLSILRDPNYAFGRPTYERAQFVREFIKAALKVLNLSSISVYDAPNQVSLIHQLYDLELIGPTRVLEVLRSNPSNPSLYVPYRAEGTLLTSLASGFRRTPKPQDLTACLELLIANAPQEGLDFLPSSMYSAIGSRSLAMRVVDDIALDDFAWAIQQLRTLIGDGSRPALHRFNQHRESLVGLIVECVQTLTQDGVNAQEMVALLFLLLPHRSFANSPVEHRFQEDHYITVFLIENFQSFTETQQAEAINFIGRFLRQRNPDNNPERWGGQDSSVTLSLINNFHRLISSGESEAGEMVNFITRFISTVPEQTLNSAFTRDGLNFDESLRNRIEREIGPHHRTVADELLRALSARARLLPNRRAAAPARAS